MSSHLDPRDVAQDAVAAEESVALPTLGSLLDGVAGSSCRLPRSESCRRIGYRVCAHRLGADPTSPPQAEHRRRARVLGEGGCAGQGGAEAGDGAASQRGDRTGLRPGAGAGGEGELLEPGGGDRTPEPVPDAGLLRCYRWDWKGLRADLPTLARAWLPCDPGDLIGPGIAVDETAQPPGRHRRRKPPRRRRHQRR
jgi:hypothetical protein